MIGIGIGITAGAGRAQLDVLADSVARAVALHADDGSSLPANIVLKKTRADYREWAVYTPLTEDGIYWARWFFTHKLNLGSSGAYRMTRATLAELYASVTTAPMGGNLSDETDNQAAIATWATTDATARVGTWTVVGSTIGGMSDVQYTSVTGDYVEYTITGVTRIAQRHYGSASLAGIASVYITENGVEISEEQYDTRPTKLIVYGAQTGKYRTPLARNLDPAKTYVVRLTVDTSNSPGSNLYDGGIWGYSDIAFDSTGIYGPAYSQNLGDPAVTTLATRATGTTYVYSVADATRIAWRHWKANNCGIAEITIYDAFGVEIPEGKYLARTVDCYSAPFNPSHSMTMLADGLEKGTYYVHIRCGTTKNESSSDYRMYCYGVVKFDTGTAGVAGTDPFDDGGIHDFTVTNGERTLIGTGNLELAIKVRKTTELVGDPNNEFVGGYHGAESAPANLAFTVDSVAVDFDAASIGDVWSGAEVQISFDTELQFLSDGSKFADASYTFTMDRLGYHVAAARTTTSDAIISEDYALMLNVPGRLTPDAWRNGANVFLVGDGAQELTCYAGDDSTKDAASRATWVAALGRRYVVHAEQLNWPGIDSAFSDPVFSGSRASTFVQDRADGYCKVYNRAFPGVSGGVLVPSGHAYAAEKRYRIGLV